MKKLLSFVLLFLLTVGLIAGCGNNETPTSENNASEVPKEHQEESAFPVTVTDALDNQVVIEEKPERIVSLIPSNTEIAFKLGLGDEVVGVSDFDNYPAAVAEKDKIGGMDFNVEKIISLKPDLVLAHGSSAHNSTEGFQLLRDSGITVLVVNNAQNFEQVYDSIKMIGKATGTQAKADQVIKGMKDKIDSIKSKASEIKDTKTVFIEVSPAPEIYTPGKNTFMHEMLTIINAKNVAGNLNGWSKINQEAIIEKNPDVIITTYGYYTEKATEMVLKRDGWQQLTAVQNEQVYDVHSDLVTRSGPRLAEGVEDLAKAVYPEVFGEK
ncbi:ABC transporter substrate-binding protein [Alkalihalobacillus sp. AL-G]|uniref:ABC transporter substrate-binding protein n=1 Tax=Alkalihalobacillus sp. AL-G TaxID=2926399 RepID=UPI00272C6F8B|nr:ABC transporter substrate-binding protein [Alkalihalobacillus sp. AL-G]WLD91659.1 ABC transporter substrate-binding protein [Alkalihalobacillus sp. AL-G]